MAVSTPVAEIGWQAPDFKLLGTDGQWHTLAEVAGPKGTLVMFICNHCPYVRAVIARIARDCRELKSYGIGSIAIMSNDLDAFPEDGPEHMLQWIRDYDLPFPYVIDETQLVAHQYGAVCTPDFFGFNAGLQLQYRGRLDASRKETAPEGARRELFEAMVHVSRTGHGPAEQTPSMGCSIKWRES